MPQVRLFAPEPDRGPGWLGLEFSNTEHNPGISRRRDVPQADETLHRWKASTRCDEAAELGRPRLTQLASALGTERLPQPGSWGRLLFHFDDVPPYRHLSLLTLRRQVGPCLGLVESHCVVHAVPLDEGDILRSRRPLYGNNPSVQGAQCATIGRLDRLAEGKEGRGPACTGTTGLDDA